MNGERFTSIEAVRAEKLRLASVRDAHAERVQSHLHALGRKDFRRSIMRSAVGDVVDGLFPDGVLGAVMGKGGFTRGVELAMGTSGGWAKRVGLFLLGMAAPSLLEKIERVPLAEIGHQIGVSLDRIKNYMGDRRAGKDESPLS